VARATGRSLSIHLHPWARTGVEVLDAVLSVGLDADRVILGHMNTAHSDERYLRSLLERGALLAFDLFGFDHSLLGLGRYPPSDADVADVIVGLVDAGHGRQLLISCDVGVRTRLRRYGGWGYEHLLTHVLPLLAAKGLDDDVLEQLLVDTPRRVLTIAAPSPSLPRK
jgi:phosphotriesterase-related protein